MARIDIERIEEEWEQDLRSPPRSALSQRAVERIDRDTEARVTAVDRGRVTVWLDDEVVEATFAGSMRGDKVVVGDRVLVRTPRHEGDTPRITRRLERGTVLTRTADDAVDEERVVVANADQVVVVVGADHLRGGVGFLDRVLVAASAGGLDAVVCVNKVDLVAADPATGDGGADLRREVAAVVAVYRDIGYEVLTTSARTGEGVQELGWRLEGCWTAMTGHSGVGKSSLFNLLVPEASQQIGALGRRGGRHTTVAAVALRVPGHDDAWLVDTPGVRSFGLATVPPEELTRHFPELAGLPCALDDCIHQGEPGCAIAGTRIAPSRWESYERLLGSLRDG